ncbi:CASP-like protein 1F1 [Tasmannia lanceolata]|uniref:CASP-like protein 1F1 n=1 Tax=Tasmannia lanceolata TaxID=3420 RepID=UPI004064290C
METQESKMDLIPIEKRQRSFVLTQIGLRTLAFGATLAATLLMATNKQTINLFGFQLDAKFSYSTACSFFVGGNAVACAYSLLSLPFIFIFNSQGSHPGNYFFLFLLDLIMTVLVMASASSATAIGYVSRKGNSHTGWMAICGQFGKFCDKAGGALVFSFAAFLLLFLLTILSVHRQRQIPLSTNARGLPGACVHP